MSDFENFDKDNLKDDKENEISDDEQSIEDAEVEKMIDDDASSDGESLMDYESDIDDDDDEDPTADGVFDEEAGDPEFTANIDDDASVSTIGSDVSDESNGDSYFQKFSNDMKNDIINDFHAESTQVNYSEVDTLCIIVKNEHGHIVDPFHKTVPILSKFEKTRVLGIRAKQINEGAKPFVEMNQGNYDGYIIASKELYEKKIPFIIRRPMPNGASEYWRLSDLEILA